MATLLLLISIVAGQSLDPARKDRIQDLPVSKLVQLLDSTRRQSFVDEGASFAFTYEAILAELVRRGGRDAQKLLSAKIREDAQRLMIAKKKISSLNQDSAEARREQATIYRVQNNLEAITALRRIEKKPDPMTIVVFNDENLEGGTRRLPVLQVALKNVDVEKQSLWLTMGGNYRTGRHSRWRIHVRNSNGKLLPTRTCQGMFGGGVFTQGYLRPRETWKINLPMSDYVDIPEPGTYTVQVLYHNDLTIADLSSAVQLSHLICCRSKVFKVVIKKGPLVTIRVEEGSSQKAYKLIDQINAKDPLRIVLGKYDKDFYSFLSPELPQGQLLKMHWQAVPALLKTLEDDKLSYRKRAWIFSLLYSITCERDLDPMAVSGALPGYRAQSAPNCYCSTISFTKGDVKKQVGLTQQWLKFSADYIRVVPATER